MNSTTSRRKQPEAVKAKLLQTAEDLTFVHGWGNFSLNDVVAKSGISKGGLLHHFPTKNVLLETLYDALLVRFDAQICELMQKDSEPLGRFLRAYLSLVQKVAETPESRLPAILRLALVAEPALREKWQAWLNTKLSVVDDDAFSLLVRLAADGLWLAYLTHDNMLNMRGFPGAVEELTAMTRV